MPGPSNKKVLNRILFPFLLLGLLVAFAQVSLWMVYILAFLLGWVNVFDNPARQTFVVEMVGEDKLRNAVTLYSSLVNLSRVIGPSIAAALIAIQRGAHIVRVHDVAETVEALRVLGAIAEES